MRHLEGSTHYELGKLRMLHDHSVHTLYARSRHLGADGVIQCANDPEVTYHLDAVDAIILATTPQEHQ